MKKNNRIESTDSTKLMIMKMSEGNPGCISFLFEFLDTFPDALLWILHLDSIGLYGARLYMLWNDCCNRDVEKVMTVLKAEANGAISAEELLGHVSDPYGRGTPFDFVEKGI